MTDQQRPEPVLDEARLLRVFGLVLSAVVAVLGVTGVVVSDELVTSITTTATVALSAGLAVWSYLAPMWRARKLREVVTPVSDPQGADGTPMVPAPTPAATAEGTTYVVEESLAAVAEAEPTYLDKAVDHQEAIPLPGPTHESEIDESIFDDQEVAK